MRIFVQTLSKYNSACGIIHTPKRCKKGVKKVQTGFKVQDAGRLGHFALSFHGEPLNRGQMVDGIFIDPMTKTASSQGKSALNDLFTVNDFGFKK